MGLSKGRAQQLMGAYSGTVLQYQYPADHEHRCGRSDEYLRGQIDGLCQAIWIAAGERVPGADDVRLAYRLKVSIVPSGEVVSEELYRSPVLADRAWRDLVRSYGRALLPRAGRGEGMQWQDFIADVPGHGRQRVRVSVEV